MLEMLGFSYNINNKGSVSNGEENWRPISRQQIETGLSAVRIAVRSNKGAML